MNWKQTSTFDERNLLFRIQDVLNVKDALRSKKDGTLATLIFYNEKLNLYQVKEINGDKVYNYKFSLKELLDEYTTSQQITYINK